MTLRFAEEANYWDTVIHPARSQGEISELLEEFGADAVMIAQGNAGGRFAWLVRFHWRARIRESRCTRAAPGGITQTPYRLHSLVRTKRYLQYHASG